MKQCPVCSMTVTQQMGWDHPTTCYQHSRNQEVSMCPAEGTRRCWKPPSVGGHEGWGCMWSAVNNGGYYATSGDRWRHSSLIAVQRPSAQDPVLWTSQEQREDSLPCLVAGEYDQTSRASPWRWGSIKSLSLTSKQLKFKPKDFFNKIISR